MVGNISCFFGVFFIRMTSVMLLASPNFLSFLQVLFFFLFICYRVFFNFFTHPLYSSSGGVSKQKRTYPLDQCFQYSRKHDFYENCKTFTRSFMNSLFDGYNTQHFSYTIIGWCVWICISDIFFGFLWRFHTRINTYPTNWIKMDDMFLFLKKNTPLTILDAFSFIFILLSCFLLHFSTSLIPRQSVFSKSFLFLIFVCWHIFFYFFTPPSLFFVRQYPSIFLSFSSHLL